MLIEKGESKLFSEIIAATGDMDNIEAITFHSLSSIFEISIELYVDSFEHSVTLDKRDDCWYSRKTNQTIPHGPIDNETIESLLDNLVKSFINLTV